MHGYAVVRLELFGHFDFCVGRACTVIGTRHINCGADFLKLRLDFKGKVKILYRFAVIFIVEAGCTDIGAAVTHVYKNLNTRKVCSVFVVGVLYRFRLKKFKAKLTFFIIIRIPAVKSALFFQKKPECVIAYFSAVGVFIFNYFGTWFFRACRCRFRILSCIQSFPA